MLSREAAGGTRRARRRRAGRRTGRRPPGPAARDDRVLAVRSVRRGVGGRGRGHRVGRRGRRVVDEGLGHVRRADAVARVGEQRPEQEGDEDAPLDADRRLDQPFLAAVGLVELAVEDQEHDPQPGAHDHRAVAAGEMERLALRAGPQQHEHPHDHDEDRRLDERVDAECGLGVVDARERLAVVDERVPRLLVPRQQHRAQQRERRDGGEALLAAQRAPVAPDPRERPGHAVTRPAVPEVIQVCGAIPAGHCRHRRYGYLP